MKVSPLLRQALLGLFRKAVKMLFVVKTCRVCFYQFPLISAIASLTGQKDLSIATAGSLFTPSGTHSSGTAYAYIPRTFDWPYLPLEPAASLLQAHLSPRTQCMDWHTSTPPSSLAWPGICARSCPLWSGCCRSASAVHCLRTTPALAYLVDNR